MARTFEQCYGGNNAEQIFESVTLVLLEITNEKGSVRLISMASSVDISMRILKKIFVCGSFE